MYRVECSPMSSSTSLSPSIYVFLSHVTKVKVMWLGALWNEDKTRNSSWVYVQLCPRPVLFSPRENTEEKSSLTCINTDAEIEINSYHSTHTHTERHTRSTLPLLDMKTPWVSAGWCGEVRKPHDECVSWADLGSVPPAGCVSPCPTPPWAWSCLSGMAMSPAIFELCYAFAGGPIDPGSDSYGCGHYSALKEPDTSDGMKELLSADGVRKSEV